jgi:RimJ/RimL family protein N-acetyltransferase
VVIATRRLNLRRWELDDAAEFSALAKDPEMMRYISGGVPHTDDQVLEFLERQIAAQAERGWCRWALELREPAPGEPAGVVGFTGPGCTFAPDVEMGWWVHRALWGQGLASESARAAVDYCFEVVGFDRLTCCVHPDNAPSLRVAEKTGFVARDEIEFRTMTLVRHELRNPHPPAVRDPRFVTDCRGCEQPEIVVTRTYR